MRQFTIRTLGLAAGLGALSLAAPAMAVPFTWNPSAAVPGAGGSFTADNITVQDYATVNVDAAGNFTENGLINLSTFNNGGTPVNVAGLDSTFAIYAQFTGTGTQGAGNVTPSNGTSITGQFNSLNYTLFAAQGTPTFSSTAGGASVSGLSNAVTLANGSLVTGTTALTRDQFGGLSATATTINSLNVVDSNFFVSPGSTFSLGFDVAFTNTGSVLSTPSANELVINGGGGNATVTASSSPPPPVPEPASFAVLGAGLIGLAMARRQRLI